MVLDFAKPVGSENLSTLLYIGCFVESHECQAHRASESTRRAACRLLDATHSRDVWPIRLTAKVRNEGNDNFFSFQIEWLVVGSETKRGRENTWMKHKLTPFRDEFHRGLHGIRPCRFFEVRENHCTNLELERY